MTAYTSFARRFALILTVSLCAVLTAQADQILLSESFESPAVTGYAPGSVPDTGWIGSTEGYKATSRGLYNQGDGSVFTTAFGEQAYLLNYTNSGLTTARGTIGPVLLDATYTLTFNAAARTGESGDCLVELVAFDSTEDDAAREECRGARPGTVLAAVQGTVSTSDMSQTFSLSYTAEADDPSLGKDLGLRLIKRGNILYDNLTLSAGIPEISSMLPVPGADGGGVGHDFLISRGETMVEEYAAFLNAAEAAGEISMTDGEVRGAASELYCYTAGVEAASPLLRDEQAPAGERFAAAPEKGTHPMVFVSWFGAAAYCNWKSAEENLTPVYAPDAGWAADLSAPGFRLPTESEWYKAAAWNADLSACMIYGTGKDTMAAAEANFLGSGDEAESEALPVTPVAHFMLESFYGLRDASGNAWEWCQDRFSDAGSADEASARSVRGGSWGNLKEDVNTRSRCAFKPGMAVSTVGFRLTATAPAQ